MEDSAARVAIEALRGLADYVERTSGLRFDNVPDGSPPPGRARGPLQQAIADLPGLIDDGGMASVEIAAAVEYAVPNIYRLLRALCENGVIEAVPGSGPHRWRLSAAHRRSPQVFDRFVRTVGPGEWTTCADLSIAGRGDLFGARLVCWAAEHVPGFPHPHRVLLQGGMPHPAGHEHERQPPGEVRALLQRERLAFTSSGCAAPARRVAWDQLRDRAGSASTGALQGRAARP